MEFLGLENYVKLSKNKGLDVDIKTIGLFLLSIFMLVGCVQKPETKVDKKSVEQKQNEEIPSYDKYKEGLDNLGIN